MNDTPIPSAKDAISCLKSVEWVSLLRDKELEADQQLKLTQHIADCERCRVASGQFTQLFNALDDLLAQHSSDGSSRHAV